MNQFQTIVYLNDGQKDKKIIKLVGKKKMKNVLKIVFLGLVGFGLLVYLTAPNQANLDEKINENVNLNTSLLPSHFEVIGISGYAKRADLFPKTEERYIVVLNHEALSLVETLKLNSRKDIILVANISKTPWFIKKLAVNGKLAELNVGSNIPMINDTSGELIKALNLFDDTQTKYFVYKVKKDSSIVKISEQSVKEGALENGLKKEEIDIYIASLLAALK